MQNNEIPEKFPPPLILCCFQLQVISEVRLKRILILVFEYSFGFKTNSPNILLII